MEIQWSLVEGNQFLKVYVQSNRGRTKRLLFLRTFEISRRAQLSVLFIFVSSQIMSKMHMFCVQILDCCLSTICNHRLKTIVDRCRDYPEIVLKNKKETNGFGVVFRPRYITRFSSRCD